MREPITKLAIVPIASIDSTIVEQLAPSLRAFSLLGGGNESPIIFFVARVVRKTSRHQNEKRVMLVTLKHVVLYDDKGTQTRALYVPDIQRLILCQDGHVVFKIAREHDLVIRLEDSAFLDYFVNILKVLNMHFHVGSPIAGGGGDVGTNASSSPGRQSATVRLLEVQGSQVAYDQLTGGNKVNLAHDGKASSARNSVVVIPSILNIDAAKQDFLSAVLFIPPPPKRTTATSGAPLVVRDPSDVALAESVLRHPLFHPPSASTQQARGGATTANNNDASTSPLALPAPAPQRSTATVADNNSIVATPVASTTAAGGAVTVRSIATIDRQDGDDVWASPPLDAASSSSARRLVDRRSLVVDPPWRTVDKHPTGGGSPPPPPQSTSSTLASPIQRLLSHHSAEYHDARSFNRTLPSHRGDGAPDRVPTSLASSFAAVDQPPAALTQPPQRHPSIAASEVSFRDRVEAFCKLYDPQSMDDVDWWVATYEGREEACLEALHRKLASRELVKSSRKTVPLAEHGYRASEPTNEDPIVQRLRALEEENRLLRDRVAMHGSSQDKVVGNSSRVGSGTTPYSNAQPQRYDNSYGPALSAMRQPTSANNEPQHRQSDAGGGLPSSSNAAAVHAAGPLGFNSFGSMERFEWSIAKRSASDRVVLRQHRIDEMRREVHEQLRRNDDVAVHGETRPLLRVGLLQDEIVALIGRQQDDRAAAEAETEAVVTDDRLHFTPSSTGSRSNDTGVPQSQQRDTTLTHQPHQGRGPPPHLRPSSGQPNHQDPHYAQWYYTEYLPKMMYAGGHREAAQQAAAVPVTDRR